MTFLGSSYVVAVLLARLLGPAEYGRVSVAIVVMTVINSIHATGIPNAVSRRVASSPEEAGGVLATAWRLQLLATAGSALLMVAGAAVYGLAEPALAPYLAAAALTIVPQGLLNLQMGYDNGRRQFGRQASLLVLYSALKAGCVLALAVLFRGLGALVGYAVASVGAWLVGRRGTASGGRVGGWSLVGFAAPVVALTGLSATQVNVDLLLVELFGGSSQETGWYAAAQQVARAPYLALGGLGLALLPVVARRQAEGDRVGLANTIRQAVRYAAILLAPAVAIVVVTPAAIIDLLFTTDYAPGAAPLPLLMPGLAALTLFSVLASALTGMGRPWVPVVIAAAALGVTIALCALLIPSHGLVGAALGTTIGGVVALAAAVAVMVRSFGAIVAPVSALRVGVAAAAAAAALAFLRPTGLGLVVGGCAVLLAYVVLLVALGEVNGDDWRRIRGVVRPSATD